MAIDPGALFVNAFQQAQANAQQQTLQQAFLGLQAEDRKRKVFEDLINITKTPKGPLREAQLRGHESLYGAIDPTFRDLIARSGDEESQAMGELFRYMGLDPRLAGVSWGSMGPEARQAYLGIAGTFLKHKLAKDLLAEDQGGTTPFTGSAAPAEPSSAPAQPTPVFGVPPLQPTVQEPPPTQGAAPAVDLQDQITGLRNRARMAAALGLGPFATILENQANRLEGTPHYFPGPEGTQMVVPRPGQAAAAVPGSLPTAKAPSQPFSPEAVAQELYPGRTWGQLTADEKGTVNKESMKRTIEATKEKAKITTEAKTEGIDIPALAGAVASGQESALNIKNAFGVSVSSQIQSQVLQQYPKFNFLYSNANARWAQNPMNARTISMIEGSLPRLSMLDEQLKSMPNADIPAINRVMRQISIQTGKPEFTNFESNRNAIVQEINTALAGSATGSDYRVKIEMENLNAARSPAQIAGAVGNLRAALLARLEPSMSPLYPIEVVRGEKTIEQYLAEIRKRYAGRYSEQAPSSAPALTPEILGLRKKYGY